jgi:adenylate cyclase
MSGTILVWTPNTELFAEISSVLTEYVLFQCSTLLDAEQVCLQQEVSLVLVAEWIGTDDGCGLFRQLRARHPLMAGLLLTRAEKPALLRRAMDCGLSGLVTLPPEPEAFRCRVVQTIAEAALRLENARLHTLLPLYSLAEKFLASTTTQEVVTGLLEEVVAQTGADHVSIMLYDEEDNCLRIAAVQGMEKELARSIRIRPGDKIAGWVFAQGKPVLLNRDSQQQSIFAPLLNRPEIASAISFPLMVRGNILGVLNISRRAEDEVFTESDKEMLGILCGQAALALENVRALETVRESTRMRTLFEQYVAPEVAELLLASRENVMAVGGVHDLTVLFADIRNFTSLVQHLPLSDLRSFLNGFFRIFTDIIFQNRGMVDKFMGDAVLAVFGAPIELDNAPLAAVQTALLLRERFDTLCREWNCQCEAFQDVDLGIAVTRGEMYIGNVGSDRRLDYTVIGTPVNIAQRLAAESSRCQIYLTEAVRDSIGGDFQVQEQGHLALRGMDEDIRVFSL